MAKKRKTNKKQEIDRSILIKLNEISEKLGVNIDKLLESYSNDPYEVVKKWEKGEIILLNE